MLNEKFLAEDITQNVFLKLYENLSNIKNKQNVIGWLYVTARNEIYGHLRKKQIKKENYIEEGIDFESEDDLLKKIEEIELKELVSGEIDLLNNELKEVFLLREYSELSYKEISGVLNIEENLIKARLFRARQQLIKKVLPLIK